MPGLLILLLPFITGAAYSAAFFVLKKARLTKTTRFFVDFALSFTCCALVYLPCFIWFDGVLMVRAIAAAATGALLPRLFIKRGDRPS